MEIEKLSTKNVWYKKWLQIIVWTWSWGILSALSKYL